MISTAGEIEPPVRFNNMNDRNGVNPAARLAAVEYKTDNTVHRNFKGNISESIAGTVA